MRCYGIMLALIFVGHAAAADIKPVSAANNVEHWRTLVSASSGPAANHLATSELAYAVTHTSSAQALSILTLCQEQPNPALIPVVASALESSDPGVQAKALRVLRTVGITDHQHAERIATLITAPQSLVAAAAIDTATNLKLENTVPALLKVAGGEDRSLAKASFAGLGRICDQVLPDTVEPWQNWYQYQQQRITEALPRIRQELSAQEPRHVIAAMQELVSLPLISGTVVQTLTTLEQHQNPQIRQIAAHLIARLIDAKTGNTSAILAHATNGSGAYDAFATDFDTLAPANTSPSAALTTAPRKPTANNGWRGLVILISLLTLGLLAALWLLRAPVARGVKSGVRRKIRYVTEEITAIRKVELGTRRLVRPVIKSMHRH